jgi:uncharacterized protein YprB with RNaseH-like and TPR domain
MRDMQSFDVESPQLHDARILFWDVETSTLDLEIRQYDLKSYKGYHNYKNITRDWVMLGGAWKFMGDDNVRCISVSPRNPLNDEAVVHTLHKVLSEADILVAHNGDAFDIKKFNARAIFYGLAPLQDLHSIDTLKEARKYFKFTSNTLGYLAQFLGLEDKGESPNWNKILDGDSDELARMREYNKLDVLVLEQVYLKLRPWMKNHPNLQAYSKIKDIVGGLVQVCKACGSPDIMKWGYQKSRTGKQTKQRYRCRCCKHAFVDPIYKGKKNG